MWPVIFMGFVEIAEDEGRGDSVKRAKPIEWYFQLESESPEPTDEDEESIYTYQGHETGRERCGIISIETLIGTGIL